MIQKKSQKSLKYLKFIPLNHIEQHNPQKQNKVDDLDYHNMHLYFNLNSFENLKFLCL